MAPATGRSAVRVSSPARGVGLRCPENWPQATPQLVSTWFRPLVRRIGYGRPRASYGLIPDLHAGMLRAPAGVRECDACRPGPGVGLATRQGGHAGARLEPDRIDDPGERYEGRHGIAELGYGAACDLGELFV